MEQSYKEKYEQAIERLKQWDREHPCAGYVLSDRDKFIFPELAESEQKPNGGIVREDFTQGDGWYKVNLDYLSKAQVEEIEQLVEKWNPKEVSEEEKIKKAILIYLDWLDGKKDYLPKGDYTIKDMILWLEKQGEKKSITFNNAHIIDSALNDYCCKQYDALHKENGGVLSFARLQHLAMDIYGWCNEYLQGEQEPEENKGNVGGISPNWSEEDKDFMYDTLSNLTELKDRYGEGYGNVGGCIDWLKSLKGRVQPKQEWGEEDEHRIKDTIYFLDTAKKHYASTEELDACIVWLQSLQDRVQPQPKQGWKQENTGDLTAFENAMMHIGGSFFGQHAGLDPNDTNSIKEQANLLLELVPSKEWSEEDKQHIRTIIHAIHGAGNITPIDGELAEDWLKSLRPQNTWKPSDEQIKAIRLARAFVTDDFSENPTLSDVLVELEEQLKKLKEGEV